MLLLAAIMALCAVTSCGSASKTDDATALRMAQIDSILTERYSADGVNCTGPGGAALVMKGDSVLFDKGYGLADLVTGAKIDGNTFFNIASCSKQFTAIAILKLFKERGLDIHGSIYDVTPLARPFLPPEAEPFTAIKVEHLMSHSSGIPDTRPRDDRNFTLTATDMESIDYIKGLKGLNFTPGERYEYMNPTFCLLYMYIEKLTGRRFVDYMHDEIFAPAGMEETLYFDAARESDIPRMAHGYVTDTPELLEAEKKFHERDYGEETFFATKADGGIYTSTHEYAKWIKALRCGRVVSEELRDLAWSKHNKVTGSELCDYQNRPNTWYGYGWFLEEQPGMPLKVYHTGDNGGFQIYEGYFPSTDLLVLVFENRNDQSRWNLVQQIDEILK